MKNEGKTGKKNRGTRPRYDLELEEGSHRQIDVETRSVGEINWDVEVDSESDMFGERPEEAELRGDMDGAVVFVNIFEIIEFFAEENGCVGAAVSDAEADVEAIGLFVKDEVTHGEAKENIGECVFTGVVYSLDA